MDEKKSGFSLLPKIINGGIGGFTGLCCVFPLDLVKTRLQKQQIGPDGKKMYNSMLEAFTKTYKAEGFFGMYKGLLVGLVFVTLEKSLKLGTNDFYRHHLGENIGPLPLHRQVLAGALVGLTACVITTPMELLKIQMQDSGRIEQKALLAGKTAKKMTTSILVRGVFRKYGFFGMYKGIRPTIMRDIWFSVIYYPSFATLNKKGPRRPDGSGEAPFWWSFLAGVTAGAIAALSATPLDVIKTRLQTYNTAEGERTYTGSRDAFTKILKYEGPSAFFKGGACRVMVIGPMLGITQSVFYLGVGEYLLGYD